MMIFDIFKKLYAKANSIIIEDQILADSSSSLY